MAKSNVNPDPDALAKLQNSAEAENQEPKSDDPETEVVTKTKADPVSMVQVLEDYGGRRTREVRIVPGIYATNDPALLGLADYLIANGKARKV